MTDGTWRWTKPFSISTAGVQAVQLFIGRHTATLNVHVAELGGLQKQASTVATFKLSVSIDSPMLLSKSDLEFGKGSFADSPPSS